MLSLLAEAPHVIHFADLGLHRGINLGFFELRFYSLAYLAGILLGYWHISKMIKAPGAPLAQRHADDLFFYCTLGIIIGGRLGYAAFYTGGTSDEPSMFTHFTPGQFPSWDLLRLWDGGMSFHGGVIGVLLAIGWVCWRNQLSFIRVADYIAVNVPFGMMFGRIANFINGELWGRPAPPGTPFAMIFPGGGDIPRYPSQLYEAALEGLLMIIIMLPLFWKTRARWRPGLMVGVFTAGIAAARFTVEFFREPDPQLLAFAERTGLSMGQWLTIPLILIGIGMVVRALVRPSLGAPSKPAPAASQSGEASDTDPA
ncbi:prolipoprotein diacylglyceryl transferase [Tsuneonella mangrovi]|uniref:prolipoprotein diacylglyceryl transferase n=1 Tax=Tsuneonella mangrovi TaxID=1982042 RepID=UPI000BA1CF9A|nr:prolipoprotein diacylglyceryl transferase [Tsuneonella mangrovi]